jgi:signal peptidase II
LTSKTHNLSLFFGIAISALTLSQLIGVWVNNTIEVGSTLEVSWLIHFTHVRNFGGVFGMLQGSGWIFAIVSIGLLSAVTAYLCLSNAIQRYEYVCFGFIVGGGASNIMDRLVYGSVIDFVDIQHIPMWNYVFNTADAFVHIGIWPMLALSFFIKSKQSV